MNPVDQAPEPVNPFMNRIDLNEETTEMSTESTMKAMESDPTMMDYESLTEDPKMETEMPEIMDDTTPLPMDPKIMDNEMQTEDPAIMDDGKTDETPPEDAMKCSENQEMVDCMPEEPKTCHNEKHYVEKKLDECKAGCTCKTGFVLDEELLECVQREQCQCKHNGKILESGERVKDGCIQCICEEGELFCSDRKCKKGKN